MAESECLAAKRARMEADGKIAVVEFDLNESKVKLNKAEHARLHAISAAEDASYILKPKTDELKKTEKALTTWASSHCFAMLRLNSNAALLPYYVIRCLNSLMQESILKIVAST